MLDETIDEPLGARRAYVSHPEPRAFMTFDGRLLHGVLPGAFAHAGAAAALSRPQQRLTLLIAWYDEPTAPHRSGRRARQGAQGSIPRPTRAHTWPAALELTAEAARADEEGAARRGTPRARGAPHASPVWEEVPKAGPASARAGRKAGDEELARLTPPPSLRQHFFLREPDEVSQRLREEHGVGGSWAAPPPKRAR